MCFYPSGGLPCGWLWRSRRHSLCLNGCAGKTTPPEPAAPRSATVVSASQGKTWDAVIDVFAERNIPIRNMERVSGLIVTEDLGVNNSDGTTWADCGRVTGAWYEKPKRRSGDKKKGTPVAPGHATYNVLVRGDSTRSTVKVTVRWTARGLKVDSPVVECSTLGVWEGETEMEIKNRAEGRE